MSLFLQAIRLIALVLALASTGWCLGRLLLARWTRIGGTALTIACGLALLAQVLFALAVVGAFRPLALLAVSALAHLAVGHSWWRELGRIRCIARWALAAPRRQRSLAALVILGAGLAGGALLALYPPTAFDETLYHLPLAKSALATAHLPDVPASRAAFFPHFGELLFAAAMAAAGETGPHAVSWLCTALTVALLVGWGRRLQHPAAGLWAAAFLLGQPALTYLAGTAYVEPLLMLLFTAAMRCATLGPRAARFWSLGGLLAGSAAAVKYLGLILGIFYIVEVMARSPKPSRRRAVVWAAFVALATLLPTYVRIVWQTGNPVYPFYSSLFGSNDAASVLVPRSANDDYLGLILGLPWRRIGESVSLPEPPFSPWGLVAFVALLVASRRQAAARRGLIAGMAYLAIVPSVARYSTPWLPLLALGGALSWDRMTERLAWLRKPAVQTIVCALLVAPGPAYAAFRSAAWGPLPRQPADRARYLTARWPLYALIDELNRRAEPGYRLYALHAEQLAYHCEGAFLGDWVGPGRFERVVPLLDDPPALWRQLHSLKVNYLLLPRRFVLPWNSRWFTRWAERPEGVVYRLAEE